MEENEIFTGEEKTRKVLAVKMLTDKWKPFHELIAAVSKACGVDPFEIAPAFLMHILLAECSFAKEAGTLVNLEGYGKVAQRELDKIKVKKEAVEMRDTLQQIKQMLKEMGAEENEDEE